MMGVVMLSGPVSGPTPRCFRQERAPRLMTPDMRLLTMPEGALIALSGASQRGHQDGLFRPKSCPRCGYNRR